MIMNQESILFQSVSRVNGEIAVVTVTQELNTHLVWEYRGKDIELAEARIVHGPLDRDEALRAGVLRAEYHRRLQAREINKVQQVTASDDPDQLHIEGSLQPTGL